MAQQPYGAARQDGGLRGPVVIAAIFGSVLLITVIAVGAFFLTREPNLQCDSGDASLNPTTTAGQVLPLTKTFDAVGGAESFICHNVDYPRDTRGLHLDQISATRDGNLGSVVEGEANAFVTLSYSGAGSSLTFEVSPFPIEPPTQGSPEALKVAGHPGKLLATDGTLTAWWSNGPLYFQATSMGTDRATLLTILASVQ